MGLLKSIGYFFVYFIWIIIGYVINLFLFPYLSYFIGNFNITFWVTTLFLGIWFLLPPFLRLIIKRKKKEKSINIEEWDLDNKFSNLDPIDLLNQGLMFLSRGSFEDAIDTFEKGLRIDSNNYELHFRKGKAFMALGYYVKALECYKIALNLNPEDSVILSNINIVQYKLSGKTLPKDLNKENAFLMEELHEYVEPNMIWNQEGAQLQMLGDFDGAYSYYKKALEINKKNLYARRNLKRLKKMKMNEYKFSL